MDELERSPLLAAFVVGVAVMLVGVVLTALVRDGVTDRLGNLVVVAALFGVAGYFYFDTRPDDLAQTCPSASEVNDAFLSIDGLQESFAVEGGLPVAGTPRMIVQVERFTRSSVDDPDPAGNPHITSICRDDAGSLLYISWQPQRTLSPGQYRAAEADTIDGTYRTVAPLNGELIYRLDTKGGVALYADGREHTRYTLGEVVCVSADDALKLWVDLDKPDCTSSVAERWPALDVLEALP